VEAQPGSGAKKGAITSVPDSLCADIVEDRKPAIGSLNLQIGEPYAGGGPRYRGGPRGSAPTPR
jgi:hypothetical protein